LEKTSFLEEVSVMEERLGLVAMLQDASVTIVAELAGTKKPGLVVTYYSQDTWQDCVFGGHD
jgi:hypothetical protein